MYNRYQLVLSFFNEYKATVNNSYPKVTVKHISTWWSWQAVLSYSHILIKLQADSNILASLEAGTCRGICLPYVLGPLLFSCESGG